MTCEVQGKISLKSILLNLPLNNVIHHLDDLKVANHKVEVERLIEEQDWKVKHSNMDYHLPFLSHGYDFTFFHCFTVAVAKVALRFVQIFQGGGKTIHARQSLNLKL